MFEAAAPHNPPIAGAVLFISLLVQRAQSLHHVVEQNRLLSARRAAQMWSCLWRARVRCPTRQESRAFR